MGIGHSHGAIDDVGIGRRARGAMLVTVALLAAATVIGLVVLWPRDEVPEVVASQAGALVVDATVLSIDDVPCAGTPEGFDAEPCAGIRARVTEGPTSGDEVLIATITSGALPRGMEPGVGIVLGFEADAPPDFQYFFIDFQRSTPLLWLAALFVAAVLVLGRLQGLRALLGLALSLGLLVWFVLPALLLGNDPLAVALVGGAAIALVAVYLAHGLHLSTTVAVLGTFASLALTGVLAWVFVEACLFTGLASEEAAFLSISSGEIDLRGLLLAGIIIGSLGVLDDVTVTQVSAVSELRRANPGWSRARLYRSALRIGRDHIASTVNTLVLAYAGASLPLLLLFTQAERPLAEVLTGEIVAIEIVRTLVGSIGLVAAVPITTALAATVAAGAAPAPEGRAEAPGVAAGDRDALLDAVFGPDV